MGSAHIFASLSVVSGENLGRGRLDYGGHYNK